MASIHAKNLGLYPKSEREITEEFKTEKWLDQPPHSRKWFSSVFQVWPALVSQEGIC